MGEGDCVRGKTRFGELLNRVSEGEEVVITRHDMPVARLVPKVLNGPVRRAPLGVVPKYHYALATVPEGTRRRAPGRSD
ncbi:MAG TPA: type II toxin-antitoxin system prevent-host-death family antitoxin [Thermoanaerobaculia bacterium]|nr:type II toxin-antitoxin system prevent-host-death family antitoxin [Thermoanaerobaculia bacterium]